MPSPRNDGAGNRAGGGRRNRSYAVLTADTAADCLRCGAKSGWSCWDLRSWTVPAIPYAGFFTRRQVTPHQGRRTARTPAPVSDRTRLRNELSQLAQRKLPATKRLGVRAWARDIARTEGELAGKIAELAKLSDLSW